MLFFLSKVAWFLLTPSSLIIGTILIAAALCVASRMRASLRLERAGRWLLAVGTASLAIAVLTPLGPSMLKSLERAYAPFHPSAASTGVNARGFDGIILLGGAVESKTVDGRVEETLNDSAERVRYAAALARQFPDATIYVAGGQVFTRPGARSEAEMTASLLSEFGIDRTRIRLETSSRSTAENAQMFGAIVGDDTSQRCYLLVTSAFHMRRAVAAFEAVGVPVAPAPTDWRTDDARPVLLTGFVENLRALDLAAHEYLGLLAQSMSTRHPANSAATCR